MSIVNWSKKINRLFEIALDQNFKVSLILILAYIVISISKDMLTYNFWDIDILFSKFKIWDAIAPTFKIFESSKL